MWDSSSFMLQNFEVPFGWSKPTWGVSLLRLGPPPKNVTIVLVTIASLGVVWHPNVPFNEHRWLWRFLLLLQPCSRGEEFVHVSLISRYFASRKDFRMQSKDLVNLGISSRFQSPSPKKKDDAIKRQLYRTCTQHPESTFSGLRWMDPKKHDISKCPPSLSATTNLQDLQRSNSMLQAVELMFRLGEVEEKNRFLRWWFQRFFIFTPTWGRFPFWLIFFRWVETTNQVFKVRWWNIIGYLCDYRGVNSPWVNFGDMLVKRLRSIIW